MMRNEGPTTPLVPVIMRHSVVLVCLFVLQQVSLLGTVHGYISVLDPDTPGPRLADVIGSCPLIDLGHYDYNEIGGALSTTDCSLRVELEYFTLKDLDSPRAAEFRDNLLDPRSLFCLFKANYLIQSGPIETSILYADGRMYIKQELWSCDTTAVQARMGEARFNPDKTGVVWFPSGMEPAASSSLIEPNTLSPGKDFSWFLNTAKDTCVQERLWEFVDGAVFTDAFEGGDIDYCEVMVRVTFSDQRSLRSLFSGMGQHERSLALACLVEEYVFGFAVQYVAVEVNESEVVVDVYGACRDDLVFRDAWTVDLTGNKLVAMKKAVLADDLESCPNQLTTFGYGQPGGTLSLDGCEHFLSIDYYLGSDKFSEYSESIFDPRSLFCFFKANYFLQSGPTGGYDPLHDRVTQDLRTCSYSDVTSHMTMTRRNATTSGIAWFPAAPRSTSLIDTSILLSDKNFTWLWEEAPWCSKNGWTFYDDTDFIDEGLYLGSCSFKLSFSFLGHEYADESFRGFSRHQRSLAIAILVEDYAFRESQVQYLRMTESDEMVQVDLYGHCQPLAWSNKTTSTSSTCSGCQHIARRTGCGEEEDQLAVKSLDKPELVSLECHPDLVSLAVTIPDYFDPDSLYAGYSPNTLDCLATPEGKNTLNFAWQQEECGAKTSQNATHVVFKYKLRQMMDPSAPSSHVADDKDILNITCAYRRDYVVNSSYTGYLTSVSYMGSNVGAFTFSMGLYRDSLYSEAIGTDATQINSPVYALVEFENNAASEFHLYVESCYATPTAEMSTLKQKFIDDKCTNKLPGSAELWDGSFEEVEASQFTYSFRFDAFRFEDSGSDVWLKCNLYVCGKNEVSDECVDPSKCATVEASGDAADSLFFVSRGKRHAPTKRPTYHILHGPLRVTDHVIVKRNAEITRPSAPQIADSPGLPAVAVIVAGALSVVGCMAVVLFVLTRTHDFREEESTKLPVLLLKNNR